jgi:hypothetical protein
MSKLSAETVAVRYTGWAALHRDPQDDRVEYACPHCGARGTKPARRALAEYHFTDGFVQDLTGEMSVCRECRRSLHLTPIVLLHDRDEARRFKAIFEVNLDVSKN